MDGIATDAEDNTYTFENVIFPHSISPAFRETGKEGSPTALDVSVGNIVIASTGATLGGTAVEEELNPDGYIIMQSNPAAATGNTVRVMVDTTVTLQNVNISSSVWALFVDPGATADLTLEGTNTLRGGNNNPALFVQPNAAVTIGGTGELRAYGGSNGAGIGGNSLVPGSNCGTVIISSGRVIAQGGPNGAGIGGGNNGSGGSVNAAGGMTAIDGTPENSGGDKLLLTAVTLFGDPGQSSISSLNVYTGEEPYDYGTNGMMTEVEGKLFLYLPEDTEETEETAVTGATAAGYYYAGSVPAGSTGTLIHDPTVTTASLPGGTVDTAYSQTLVAVGSTPITWSIDSGGLPGGLSLTGDTISGTPAAAGTFTFTVKAANAMGNDTQELSITVVMPPPIVESIEITPSSIMVEKGGTRQFYAEVIGMYDPAQTVTWGVSGNNSAGTSIGNDGLLTVAADETAGTLTVTATSTVNDTKSGTATVTVSETPPVYTATVTMNKDGVAWTDGAPEITVGPDTDNDLANGSSFVNGIYSIYANGTDTGVDITVSDTAATATLNYYTLTLTPGTGITSVSGYGVYLSGTTAYIDAVVSDGYTWEKWSDDNTTKNRTVTVTATTTLTATATITPPTFVAVTNITGVPTMATADTPLTLTGTVAPANATNKTILWSVKDAGTTGATVSGNTLSTTGAGTVTVTATITNGATASTDYEQDFDITVNAPSQTVTSVTVNPPTITVQKGSQQQFSATVNGMNNPAQTVTWSVYGGGDGTAIDADGLLTIGSDEMAETLTVTATSTVDTSKSGNAAVTVTDVPPTSYAATVTVNKDGGPWSSGAPEITIGATGSSASANGSEFVNGTYNIYADSTDTNVDITVSNAAATAALNYYTLTLTAGTGITSVSGEDVYLSGTEVAIDAVVTAGYTWEKWSDNVTIKNRTITVMATTTLTASATLSEPTVTSVTVTPSTVSVQKGGTQSFSAMVNGTNDPAQTVTWSVYGNSSGDTDIDIDGLLTIAADEAAETLTVTATSTVDDTKSGTATVTVTDTPSTDKILLSVTAPAAITGVTNGTVKTASALGLPSGVTLVTDGGNVQASVTWDVAGSSYDPYDTNAQTFTVSGTVTLPDGVINPDNVSLNVSISVTVNARSSGDNDDNGDDDDDDNGGGSQDGGKPQAGASGIPVLDLKTPGRPSHFTVNTDIASVKLPSNMLTGTGISGSRAEIVIKEGDKTKLPPGIRNKIGNKPLIQLTLLIDGKQVDWRNNKAPVTVSIPYKPTPQELRKPGGIVVWYIDGDGKEVSVPNGRYDPRTGTVTFTTTHFSYYAVVYNPVEFGDVAEGTWYYDAVSFIAARDITTGTVGGKYSPESKLIRGEFIVLLMRAYEIAPEENPADNFADAGNTYYTGYLAAAKGLGISAGIGNNLYAPDKEITRQEMFTLMYNALKAIEQLPEGDSGKNLSDFTDAGDIASWANDAMTLLVKTGIAGGSNGALNPTGTTTRAEMAQILYNLLGK